MSNPQLPPITGGAIPAAEVERFLRSSGLSIDELMLALIKGMAGEMIIDPFATLSVLTCSSCLLE